jgi:hypothetical protein
MRTRLAAVILLLFGMPAFGHRLDEYLQGTIVSVGKNRIQLEMTLTLGVAVFPFLISSIDADGNGAISEKEQRDYARQVANDLSMAIDGHRLTPELVFMHFPSLDEMKNGRGEIRLDFSIELRRGGRNRIFTLENHHQSRISVYQVNVLVPRDPDIQIAAQDRNYVQSVYRLRYTQSGAGSEAASFPSWADAGWLGVAALVLFARPVFLWRKLSTSQQMEHKRHRRGD